MSSEGLPVNNVVGTDVELGPRSTAGAANAASSSQNADSAAASADAAWKFSRVAQSAVGDASAAVSEAQAAAEAAAASAQNAALSANAYDTLAEAQNDINDGVIPLNSKFNVRSTDPLIWVTEYINQSGVATATGKVINSGAFFNSIPRSHLATTFMFNGPIPGATIASAIKDGIWFGATASSYSDAPEGMTINSIVVSVSEMTGTGNFKRQQIQNFSKPSQILERRIDIQRGTATGWMAPDRSDTFTFAGTVATGASLMTCTVDGIHYANAGVYPDLPPGFPINRAFTVDVWEVTGSKRFKQQEIRNFTTIYQTYIRTIDLQNNTATNWVSNRTTFVGIVSSGSYNDIVEDGTHITIAPSVTDGPPVAGSYFVRVATSLDSNSKPEYCLQEARLLTDPTIKFVRITRPSRNPALFPEWKRDGGGGSGSSQFQDKVMACFGDSLEEQSNQTAIISARLGATGLKLGFGGCRMGKHSNAGYDGMSMYNIAKAIGDNDFTALLVAAQQVYDESSNPKDDNRPQANIIATTDWGKVDYAVIAFGTNDFGGSETWNNVIGNVTDFTPDGSTFCGSINYIIDRLLTRNPKMRIIFMSPIWRQKTPTAPNGIVGGSDVSQNLNGDYLIQFVDALVECCQKNHVEVWDGYRTSGIGQLTAEVYIADKVHPTTEGYQLLADKKAAFLVSKF